MTLLYGNARRILGSETTPMPLAVAEVANLIRTISDATFSEMYALTIGRMHSSGEKYSWGNRALAPVEFHSDA